MEKYTSASEPTGYINALTAYLGKFRIVYGEIRINHHHPHSDIHHGTFYYKTGLPIKIGGSYSSTNKISIKKTINNNHQESFMYLSYEEI
jgi:hypothetical protein